MSDHGIDRTEMISLDLPEVRRRQTYLRAKKASEAGRRRELLRRNVIAYIFLLPAIVLFLLFSIYPIVSAIIYSFEQFDYLNPPTWVGFQNFAYIFKDQQFWYEWRNCFVFLFWNLIFFILPVLLAIAINEMRPRIASYFRFVYYLPAMLPPVVTYYLWQWMYDQSNAGLLNSILAFLHLPTSAWLSSPQTVIFSIVLMDVWGGVGGGMLIYLALLQSIPSHLYDAAEMDGATILQRIWHITLPQMRVIIMYNLLFCIMGSFQIFQEVLVLTGGGPVYASVTPVMRVYEYAFAGYNYGAANALSIFIFVLMLGLSLVYLRLAKSFTGLGRF